METPTRESESPTGATVEVLLSDSDLRRLDERARLTGCERAEYAGLLIRKGLAELPVDEALEEQASLEALLAPIHRGFERSGMSEEAVCRLLEEELQEVRRQRKIEGPA